MAMREDGTLVDPWGGERDLRARVLRHVSPAFVEDPVRVLRVARFAARFTDFTLAPETLELMRRMVAEGELDHLVAERVWQELARGLMEHRPSRMFELLRDCGALAVLLPEVERLWGVPQAPVHHPEVDTGVHLLLVLDCAARLQAPLPVRFACLGHDLGKGETPPEVLPRHLGHEGRSVKLLQGVCERLKVPNDCAHLAEVVAREHGNVHRSGELGAKALLRLLERCDALRRPERFEQLLLACECDMRGRAGRQDADYPPRRRLQAVLRWARGIDTRAVSSQALARGLKGPAIGEAVQQARVAAIEAGMSKAADAGDGDADGSFGL
jgi:tRNA nucleotidyltransferase (CCA-adding enzyme)